MELEAQYRLCSMRRNRHVWLWIPERGFVRPQGLFEHVGFMAFQGTLCKYKLVTLSNISTTSEAIKAYKDDL